jgi:uncharacterized membrane protein YkvA (DUF1232 family)
MKVSFELSPRDLKYFRERLDQVRKSAGASDEALVIRGAEDLLREARAAQPPEFVLLRLTTLERLIAMLHDREWRLEGADRGRILDALAYFVDPDDMIPDRLPGIGFLDDAIMVELVAQELKHEIEAYEDFCRFRETTTPEVREAALEKRRAALQARMRRRRRQERQARASRGRSRRSPLSLW